MLGRKLLKFLGGALIGIAALAAFVSMVDPDKMEGIPLLQIVGFAVFGALLLVLSRVLGELFD